MIIKSIANAINSINKVVTYGNTIIALHVIS